MGQTTEKLQSHLQVALIVMAANSVNDAVDYSCDIREQADSSTRLHEEPIRNQNALESVRSASV